MRNIVKFRCALISAPVLVISLSVHAQQAQSIPQLQAAVRRDPVNPDLCIQLGLAYWQINDDADALQAFQKCAEVNPQSAEAHNWLGTALMKKSDFP